MKRESLKVNFTFQTIYQILTLVLPFVMAPYLTRILGSEQLGIYNYTNSIAYYFLLVANLGISRYGQRLISSNRKDQTILRKSFWSLSADHVMVSLVILAAYAVFIFGFHPQYETAYIIQFIYVASALFDITWLFYGLENFSFVVITNGLVRAIECVLVFTLIKTSDDLNLYIAIATGTILLSQVALLPYAFVQVKPIKFGWNDMKVHWKPMLILFTAALASALYTVFDKTLLGLMSNQINDVAFYEYANKVITVPKSLLNVVGVVMFPRACLAAAEHDEAAQQRYMEKSFLFISFLGSAFAFGLLAIGQKFAVVYYGEEFAESGKVIMMMTPLILIVLLGDVCRSEYLIPLKKDFGYTLGIAISAVINIGVSALLIHFIGIYGAVAGTLVAETFNFIYELVLSRKIINWKHFSKEIIPYLFAGAIMFAVVYLIDIHTSTAIGWILGEIGIGAAVYLPIAFLLMYIFDKVTLKETAAKLFHKRSTK